MIGAIRSRTARRFPRPPALPMALATALVFSSVACRYKGEDKESKDKASSSSSGSSSKASRAKASSKASRAKARTDKKPRAVEGRKGAAPSPRSAAQGAPKYDLRRKAPFESGDRYEIDYKLKMTNRHTLTWAETRARRGAERYKVKYKALAHVKKVGKHGYPSRVTHTVQKWTVQKDNSMAKNIVHRGTKIEVYLKNGFPVFDVKGQKVEKFHLIQIWPATRVANDVGSRVDGWLPEEPQPVGATWPIKKEAVLKTIREKFRPKEVKGKAKLVAISKLEDTPCFELETELEAKGGGLYNFIKGIEHFKVIKRRVKAWHTVKIPVDHLPLPYEVFSNQKAFSVLRGRASLSKLQSAGRSLPSSFRGRMARYMRKGGGKGPKYEGKLTVDSHHQTQLKVTPIKTTEVAGEPRPR